MKGDFSHSTTLSIAEVLKEQNVALDQGLSAAEVHRRVAEFGKNEIATHPVSAWAIFGRQFASSFVWLLLVAGLISWSLGERIDAVVIYLFVLMNATISFFQEYRSEQTVKLLTHFIEPKARVRREGRVLEIDRAEIVVGDVVLLQAGDMVPVDLRFVVAQSLLLDESPLTGESVAIPKNAEPMVKVVTEAYQAVNCGFFGTTVTAGRGEGVVIAVGMQTLLGGVARLTSETTRESGFTLEINKFSRFVLKVILLTLVALFVVKMVLGGGAVSLPQLLIFSIALAVSVVPEALPVVTTFSLSHGALRLAKHKVVVKRLAAIEDLGSIEVLCTDKTGTLTENHLSVDGHYGVDRGEILRASGRAACHPGHAHAMASDAFDLAIVQAFEPYDIADVKATHVLTEIPFDPMRRRNSVMVKKGSSLELIVRGAPEVILSACTLSDEEQKAIAAWVAERGRAGCRTLAVASRSWQGTRGYTIKDEERGLTLVGLIAFVDPIKSTTKSAIAKARSLGITMKILTGDSREVAGAVAHAVGLIADPSQVITGDEFSALAPAKRHQVVQTFSVFARVSPEQKYEIIQLLQEKFQVGFLGEGINDAPALKIANVGLVVQNASDIARDAADIVLLQSSLHVIIEGIVEGRIVFANTLKYIKATLASNFGNFYAIAIASLFIEYLPLLPLQILLVNFLTDLPMISIATDTIDAGELVKPETYHIRDIALFTTMLGLVSTVFDLIFFSVFRPMGETTLQTSWFIGSVLTELVFLISVRTRLPFFLAKRPSFILIGLSILSAAVSIVLPYTQFGHQLFQFSAPTHQTMVLVLIIVGGYFVATETAKLIYGRFTAKLVK